MFNMQSCYDKALIVEGDRFFKGQCPQNDIERDRMKAVSYSSVVGSLCDTPNPRCPLTTHQPAEFYVSHIMKHTHE